MRQILELAMLQNAKYQIQFIDGRNIDSWTVPVLLTPERIDKMLEDISVDKIKLIFDV